MSPRTRQDLPPTPEQIAFVEQAMANYGRQTYNYAYRLVGNGPDAHDLTQEAFIRVFRAWQSFRPGTSFRSWIFPLVTHLHRDELRRFRARRIRTADREVALHRRAVEVDPWR